jgi:hypothetical protein
MYVRTYYGTAMYIPRCEGGNWFICTLHGPPRPFFFFIEARPKSPTSGSDAARHGGAFQRELSLIKGALALVPADQASQFTVCT